MPNLCVKSEFLLVECNGSFGVPYNVLHYSYENSTVPPIINVKSLNAASCVVGLCIDTWTHTFCEVKKSRSYSAVILLNTCQELKRKALRGCTYHIFSWPKRYWVKTSMALEGRETLLSSLPWKWGKTRGTDHAEHSGHWHAAEGSLPSSRWPSIYLNESG